jgi:hypothetical protein
MDRVGSIFMFSAGSVSNAVFMPANALLAITAKGSFMGLLRKSSPEIGGAGFPRTQRRPRSHKAGRRGAAVVEFAIVAPLIFLLIFGIIEVGRLVLVQQILTNASREGARRAVLEQATAVEVQTVAEDYLSKSSISDATVTVSPTPLSSLGFGDSVTVTCSVPFKEVSWLPGTWFFGSTVLSAESVMSVERPE